MPPTVLRISGFPVRSRAQLTATTKFTYRNGNNRSKIDYFVHGATLLGLGEASVNKDRDWTSHLPVDIDMITDVSKIRWTAMKRIPKIKLDEVVIGPRTKPENWTEAEKSLKGIQPAAWGQAEERTNRPPLREDLLVHRQDHG